MFKSKSRPIVTPQSEHLKLVGTLAMLWGNKDFDIPPVERASMIAGMGLHDRGYGYLDHSAIGGMSAEEWNGIARRGFYMGCSDIVADTIAKYHVRRLAGHDESPERKAMAAEFSQAINEQLERHGLSSALFDRMDRITDLCDMISFSFCMDAPRSGKVGIFPRNHEERVVAVHYHVENGLIHVEPWPFSVESHSGYLLAFQEQGYPERLDPFILTYRLVQNVEPRIAWAGSRTCPCILLNSTGWFVGQSPASENDHEDRDNQLQTKQD